MRQFLLKDLINILIMLILGMAAAYAARIGYTICAGWLIFSLIIVAFKATRVAGDV